MNKKLIGSVAVLAVVVAVLAIGANRRRADIAVPHPRVVSTAPAAAIAQPAEAPDDDEGKLTQLLKGKDFTLRVTENGNQMFRNLEVSMADGRPVHALRSMDGQIGELSNTTFAPADNFELKQVIPGDVREQILCKGSELLNRGEGMLGTYSLYRINGDQLQELISLVTEREVEDGNGLTPQKLSATVEETTRDGQPAIVYRVKAGALPERTIEFRWNGKRFEDASGEYAKIASEYRP